MNARLALTSLPLCVLLVACATSAGGGEPGRGTVAESGQSGASGPDSAGAGQPDGEPDAGSGGSGSSAGQRTGGASTDVPARTTAERRADLDDKLDASLDRFDETLRGEQQRTAAERDAKSGARADGAVVDATSSGEGAEDNMRRNRAGDLQSTGLPDSGQAESGQVQGGSGADAKEIPSGVDDDIIARRLRRAAENETDPELKEKLWDEYRDYKENTQGAK
jgi:hypothetical protein